MARGINKVILIGNLGADPEVRFLPGGSAVANITVATSESWTDKNTNERKEATEWHRVVFFGKLAEIVGEYARKGSKLYLEGKLKTRKWTDQQGVERYTTEIHANEMQLLDSRPDGQAGQAAAPQGGYNQAPANQAPRNQPPQTGYQNQPQGQQRPYNQPPQQQGFAQPQQQGFAGQQRGPGEPPIDFDDDIPF